jgi:hypothetical protein
MNEQLKELAKKSGLLGRKFMFGQYYDDELTDEQKKFAELLVKECMKVSRGADGLDATHEAWYLIKEHFGVEE